MLQKCKTPDERTRSANATATEWRTAQCALVPSAQPQTFVISFPFGSESLWLESVSPSNCDPNCGRDFRKRQSQIPNLPLCLTSSREVRLLPLIQHMCVIGASAAYSWHVSRRTIPRQPRCNTILNSRAGKSSPVRQLPLPQVYQLPWGPCGPSGRCLFHFALLSWITEWNGGKLSCQNQCGAPGRMGVCYGFSSHCWAFLTHRLSVGLPFPVPLITTFASKTTSTERCRWDICGHTCGLWTFISAVTFQQMFYASFSTALALNLLLPRVSSFLTAAWQDRLFCLIEILRKAHPEGRIRGKVPGRNGKA